MSASIEGAPLPPAWLAEETELVVALGAALDRFDRQPGELRQRAVSLPAERYLPSLRRADVPADQTWALVQELERRAVLSIRRARRGPYDADWAGARLMFAPASEPVLRAWLSRERLEPAMQAWRRAVQERVQSFPGGCEALLARRISIAGRTSEEIVDALARLGEVRVTASLRQLSTHVFWGDSKVLDEREDLVRALFPQLKLRERPIVVAVYLPERMRGVLFIENQDSYCAAIEGEPPASAGYALVYMAGFRGTALRIRTQAGARLHFSGPGAGTLGTYFEQSWFDARIDAGFEMGGPGCAFEPSGPDLYFWGDLDFAGMQILKSLRERFGGVAAWPPGYQPMLAERLATVTDATGPASSRQVDPGTTGCSYADEVLLPAIRRHGFWDQERLAG